MKFTKLSNYKDRQYGPPISSSSSGGPIPPSPSSRSNIWFIIVLVLVIAIVLVLVLATKNRPNNNNQVVYGNADQGTNFNPNGQYLPPQQQPGLPGQYGQAAGQPQMAKQPAGGMYQ
jgi:hypothetical protein